MVREGDVKVGMSFGESDDSRFDYPAWCRGGSIRIDTSRGKDVVEALATRVNVVW